MGSSTHWVSTCPRHLRKGATLMRCKGQKRYKIQPSSDSVSFSNDVFSYGLRLLLHWGDTETNVSLMFSLSSTKL